MASEQVPPGGTDRHTHPDSGLSRAPVGGQVLACCGERWRHDGGAHHRPAALWKSRNRRQELNLDVVYVGLGSEADFAGRDVRGKAVLLVKASLSRQAGPPGILKRAEDHGAAAILSTDLRGANDTEQAYRAPTKVPTFLLGTKDADTIRELIGNAPANDPPHILIRLDADWVSNQKSYLVWGTLPGETDETIYVIAHRDGWFDAAGDNASGVASMIGLVEYFAKLPRNQRRRTMIFIGTDGHHNIRPGEFGNEWLVANRAKLFSKTALMINDEHPAERL